MKVALNCLSLVNGEYSGVQAAVLGLIQALAAKASEDFQLLFLLRKGVELPFSVEGKSFVEIVHKVSPLSGKLGRIWFETHGIDKLLRRHHVDLLHNPVYLSCRTAIKQVCTVHDVFALQFPALCRRLNRWHYQKRLPYTLRFATRIITPTDAVKSSMLQLKQVKNFRESLAQRSKMVHWGIDEIFYQTTPEEIKRVAQKYELPQNYVLFAGRQEPKKNIGGIMKAFFTAVCSTGTDYKLVCCGPQGWGGRSLREEAVSLGFEDRLQVCGFLPREDLPGLYAGASALLFPSFAEGFGLPVMEAMACGTPVVCSDIPALREIASDAAVFCHPGNLAQMREALEKIFTDEQFAAELQKKGTSRAEDFHWDVHVENVIHFYHDIYAGKICVESNSRSYEFSEIS